MPHLRGPASRTGHRRVRQLRAEGYRNAAGHEGKLAFLGRAML
jgi:hypothetical protein